MGEIDFWWEGRVYWGEGIFLGGGGGMRKFLAGGGELPPPPNPPSREKPGIFILEFSVAVGAILVVQFFGGGIFQLSLSTESDPSSSHFT